MSYHGDIRLEDTIDIKRTFVDSTGLPVIRAEDPLTAVVMGTGRCLEELSLLRDVALASS